MIVVGLDLSVTRTGVAIIGDDGALSTHSYETEKVPKHAGEGYKLMRLLRIARWVITTIAARAGDKQPLRIGYEMYAFSGSGLTRLAEQNAIVRSQIYLNFVTVPLPMTAEEARKFVFGSSLRPSTKAIPNKAARKRAIKEDVLARLAAKGVAAANADEADAAVIALVMDAYVNRRAEHVGAYENELFERLDARGL